MEIHLVVRYITTVNKILPRWEGHPNVGISTTTLEVYMTGSTCIRIPRLRLFWWYMCDVDELM